MLTGIYIIKWIYRINTQWEDFVQINGNVGLSTKQFLSLQSCFATVILEASSGSEKYSVDPVFFVVSYKACLTVGLIPHFRWYSDISCFELSWNIWVTLYLFPVIGMFPEFLKATFRFIVAVHPSVWMDQHISHWVDFHEVWCLRWFFWKSYEKIQVSLKYDKNNRYFTWKPLYSCDKDKLPVWE